MTSGNPLFGAATMVVATSVRIAIQIAILPIIGRMLGPHAYGQIALVAPFVFFAMMLATSGLSTCIVRADEVTEELKGTLFCFSMGVCLILMACFAGLAYPLGRFFSEPKFPPLLIGMSFILPLAALHIVPAGLLLRAKKYHALALSDIASSLAGIITVITCILLGLGVWSLVAQQLALWVSKAAIIVIAASDRPRFFFRWRILREHLKFASNITGGALVTFIAGNIDNVLIGAFLGTESLGFYALAFQIIGLPQFVLSASVYNTLLAGVSEEQRSGGDGKALFLKTLRGIMLLCLPAMIGLAVTASLLVPLVMGARWLPMAGLIELLVPFGVVQVFGVALGAYLAGIGRPGLSLRMTLVSAALTIAAIITGVCIGTEAVALGVTLASLIGLVAYLAAIWKECGVRPYEIAQALAAPFFSAAAMGCAVVALQWLAPDTLSLASRLVASIVGGMCVYGLMLFALFHDDVAADLAEVRAAMPLRLRRRQ